MWQEYENWLWIWKLRIPEKIKTLIWLCLHEALPTNVFRFNRGVVSSMLCSRCNLYPETVLHCLRDCPMARPIWDYMQFPTSDMVHSADIKTWISSGVHLDELVFCATLWWIWRDRNNSIFNPDEKWSPLKVKALSLSLAKELNLFNHMQPATVPMSLLVDWSPPNGSIVKINCDASVHKEGHVAGFGCVIRNSTKCWIKGCFGTLPTCSVLRGELFAIWRGLFLAWECGYRDVCCETDCLDAFLAAQLHFNPNHAADTDLIVKIQDILLWNWNAKMVLIQRTTNKTAVYLAKYALESSMKYVELLEPLSNMRSVLWDSHCSSSIES
ncbi:hypothetical protein PIB30_118394 [Stylosanthes scabra]|uniref:Uncharacterized protein n=1 Tax=Stylosanthes scabra TaxID=79078 RepID=A0ABU6Y5Z7_9FABA|nr:hypothetical protein [Stylosanthes scabra]